MIYELRGAVSNPECGHVLGFYDQNWDAVLDFEGRPGTFHFRFSDNSHIEFPRNFYADSYEGSKFLVNRDLSHIVGRITNWGHNRICFLQPQLQSCYDPHIGQQLAAAIKVAESWLEAAKRLTLLGNAPGDWQFEEMGKSVHSWYANVLASLEDYDVLPILESIKYVNGVPRALDDIKMILWNECSNQAFQIERSVTIFLTAISSLTERMVGYTKGVYLKADSTGVEAALPRFKDEVDDDLEQLGDQGKGLARAVKELLDTHTATAFSAGTVVNFQIISSFMHLPGNSAGAVSCPYEEFFFNWLRCNQGVRISDLLPREGRENIPVQVFYYLGEWSLKTLLRCVDVHDEPSLDPTFQLITGRSLLSHFKKAIDPDGSGVLRKPSVKCFMRSVEAARNLLARLLSNMQDTYAYFLGKEGKENEDFKALYSILKLSNQLMAAFLITKTEPQRKVTVPVHVNTNPALEEPAASAWKEPMEVTANLGDLSVCQGTVESPPSS